MFRWQHSTCFQFWRLVGEADTQFSREGGHLAFLYGVGRCQKLDEQKWTYQFTVAADGSGLWRVPVVAGGRHDFGRGGRLLVCDGTGYYEVLARREVHRLELPTSGEWPALVCLSLAPVRVTTQDMVSASSCRALTNVTRVQSTNLKSSF